MPLALLLVSSGCDRFKAPEAKPEEQAAHAEPAATAAPDHAEEHGGEASPWVKRR
jgi:hypothetical protein